jgi:hypothetical protein
MKIDAIALPFNLLLLDTVKFGSINGAQPILRVNNTSSNRFLT